MQRQFYFVRMAAVALAMAAGLAALAVHVYRLQVVRHEELHEKARAKYTASRTELGRRGRIFDVEGNLLAGSLACRDIMAEPRHFTCDKKEIIGALSCELGVSPALMARRFALTKRTRKRRLVEIVVKRGVAMETAERLAGYRFRGIRGVDTYRRCYPKDALLANVLGFTNVNGRGVSGVEESLDGYLQPTAGKAVYERDRKGNQLTTGKHALQAPRDGADVYLTISEPIQQIVEDELAALVTKFEPKAAYAVMADPRTGAIKAMAQYPTFNPNDRDSMRPSHWRNRVVSDGFEPGSVMKTMAVAGALDYGVITMDSTFDCERGRWVYHRRPLHDSHPYGDLRVWEIIQKSSNIGAAKIALTMGENRLYQTLTRFGFGKSTGILLRGEATGIYRPLKKWDSLSITRFPIGQGILVTPLQLVQAYAAIANRGVMMKPYLVDRIVWPDTGQVELFSPRLRRRAVRPETARRITAALKLVTQAEGTAPKAAVSGYAVAGKTGTAQKVERYRIGGKWKGRYVSRYVACFIGFVPADDPAFVLLVAADEPSRGGHYGGTVAAPTFSRIAEKTLCYLQVAPSQRLPPTPEPKEEDVPDDTPRETLADLP